MPTRLAVVEWAIAQIATVGGQPALFSIKWENLFIYFPRNKQKIRINCLPV
jgi:hypothetical protein